MCIFLFKLTISTYKCFCHIDDFTICLWRLNKIQYVQNQMWWKNEPPYLAITPHVIFVDCDLVAIIYWQYLSSIPITHGIEENTYNFVSLYCSFLWHHLYYKLVCNLGFKVRFQWCSRKGGHGNGSKYGIIIHNGNTQHFVSNMWNILLHTFCCLHVYVIYFHSFVCFISRSMVFKNQISIVLS